VHKIPNPQRRQHAHIGKRQRRPLQVLANVDVQAFKASEMLHPRRECTKVRAIETEMLEAVKLGEGLGRVSVIKEPKWKVESSCRQMLLIWSGRDVKSVRCKPEILKLGKLEDCAGELRDPITI